jgi:hypothetical protein
VPELFAPLIPVPLEPLVPLLGEVPLEPLVPLLGVRELFAPEDDELPAPDPAAPVALFVFVIELLLYVLLRPG